MPMLFGDNLSREEVLQRVGSIGQIAGVRPFRYTDGRADGVKAADVRTGSGLGFTVLLDRGMDIAHAEFAGKPVSWDSKNGVAAPGFFERPGQDWLRTFGGGLLTTCGLIQVGPPNVDGGEELGLHGRISHLPAERFDFDERLGRGRFSHPRHGAGARILHLHGKPAAEAGDRLPDGRHDDQRQRRGREPGLQ